MKSYETLGNPSEADCVIALSFGTSVGVNSVNAQLADMMIELSDGRPMIADRPVVDALPFGDYNMLHVVKGPVTNIKGEGVDTWRILNEARYHMIENYLHQPLMIAQASHIGRVVRQAAKLGIESIVPEGLPTDFDWASKQIWTKSQYLWVPFNALGSIRLKRQDKL